jgi:hypothetical protein
MSVERNAVDMLFELESTLNTIDKALGLLARVTGLEMHTPYMSKAEEHLRWSIRRLSQHAFRLSCQINRT